jgi:hypothetical protein
MTNLFSKAFLVASIAVGALWAGTLQAQVADFVQVNLVPDIPGLATEGGDFGLIEAMRQPAGRIVSLRWTK